MSGKTGMKKSKRTMDRYSTNKPASPAVLFSVIKGSTGNSREVTGFNDGGTFSGHLQEMVPAAMETVQGLR